jgi:hypothetical protein
MEGPRVDEADVVAGGVSDGCVGSHTSELRLAAMRCARELAQGRRDSLQVWRRLRRLFPDVTLAETEPLLDEVLAP